MHNDLSEHHLLVSRAFLLKYSCNNDDDDNDDNDNDNNNNDNDTIE